MSFLAILKGLLKRENKEYLVSFLPLEEEEKIKEEEPSSFEEKEYYFFNSIHYSWFIKTLSGFSKKEIGYFLPLFHKMQASAIEKEFQSGTITTPDIVQIFLKKELEESLGYMPMPTNYLPASPLNKLIFKTKQELVECIDFLSLYDLAFELHRLINPKIIKKVTDLLPKEKLAFLKTIRSSSSLQPLNLEKWNGEGNSLKKILHNRGLNRFGMALSSQHRDLTWYICHILDVGRGTILLDISSKKINTNISKQIIKNIEEVLSWIEKK